MEFALDDLVEKGIFQLKNYLKPKSFLKKEPSYKLPSYKAKEKKAEQVYRELMKRQQGK